jgi:glycosyltransferase involved in cell wall biosynthesis
MVARKAIVASATAGIPEAIAHERDGLLVPPGEIDPLTDALRIVLMNPAKRLALAEAAASRAHREFTVEVMADRYEALYEESRSCRHRTAASA